ncbi:MAG: anhydro-N-acetylmuramic acid kinase [Bacteroidales bacterium]|nr:anhydro-N-acetylmuramic acid kinase [Bacteroidales bacterium]
MPSHVNEYEVIGLMSGTSLDGLDIACVRFTKVAGKWCYVLLAAETAVFPDEWRDRLSQLFNADGMELAAAHAGFGHWCGRQVAGFMRRHGLKPWLVASHGHTVFHQPERGFTLQIGDGAAIAAECGVQVVCDFRAMDVALGGQGAPLVPIGDELLFPEYDACLNIGGIANISFRHEGRRVAFDIAPANQVFNFLAGKRGLSYDKDGAMATAGRVDAGLLAQLDGLSYYRRPFPKSLGREWVDAEVLPLFWQSALPLEDLLSTAVEHTAFQIARVVKASGVRSLLMTGGGVRNLFLRKRLSSMLPEVVQHVPSDGLVDYKEALVFAFLGLLRALGLSNSLQSVTGASRNNCGGALWLP